MMKNADMPPAILFPFTAISAMEMGRLAAVFGCVGILETAFTQPDLLPDSIIPVSVFSKDELLQVQKRVAAMTEMGQNDSSNLRNTWHLTEQLPPLMPEISSIADEIRYREKGEDIDTEIKPPTDGVLLSLFEEWDWDQLDVMNRFRFIADSEKKLFQELLATETGMKTRLENGALEIDLGTYQTEKRICAWIDCASRIKETVPAIWVTFSQSVKDWLLHQGWIYEPITLGVPKDLGDLNSKQNFWKTLASFPTRDYAANIADLNELNITLWRIKDPIRTKIKKDVVFCWIGLDG